MATYENDDWAELDVFGAEGFEVRRAIDPQRVIELPEGDDGRSNWFWLRAPDGDLMLACFPHGDGYRASETDWGRSPATEHFFRVGVMATRQSEAELALRLRLAHDGDLMSADGGPFPYPFRVVGPTSPRGPEHEPADAGGEE